MERHMSTEEVLFAGDKPIILSIANSDPYGMPQAKDVVSLLMEPGDLVVRKRGIWHDACHAVEGHAQYYFLTYSNGRSRRDRLEADSACRRAGCHFERRPSTMKQVKAIHATPENFKDFGVVTRLTTTTASRARAGNAG